ncbi:MAG TPA: hypothetical protein VIY86_14275, partial [Pirellulaceae bacterium]
MPVDQKWQIENVGFDLTQHRIIASYSIGDANEVGWALWDLDADTASPAHRVTMPTLGDTYAHAVDVTRSGDQMAIGFDEALMIYGMEDFQRINYYGIDSTKAVAFSPTIPYLATANIRGWITIWNSVTNRPLATLHHPRQGISLDDLAFSGDGNRLASSNSSSIQVWNLAAANEKLVMAGHRGGIPSALFDAQGEFLTTGGKDDFVRVWNPTTGEIVQSFNQGEAVQALSYSVDGRLLAVGTMGSDRASHVRILDAQSGKKLYESDPSFGEVYSLAWSSGVNGTYLAIGGKHRVALWLVRPGDPLRVESVLELDRNRCLAMVLDANAKW